MRPASMTSIGGMNTVPPLADTLATASSALSTFTYVIQATGASGFIWGPMPATVLPPRSHTEYPPASGGPSGQFHPNSAP